LQRRSVRAAAVHRLVSESEPTRLLAEEAIVRRSRVQRSERYDQWKQLLLASLSFVVSLDSLKYLHFKTYCVEITAAAGRLHSAIDALHAS
jgi:hypothetical protein